MDFGRSGCSGKLSTEEDINSLSKISKFNSTYLIPYLKCKSRLLIKPPKRMHKDFESDFK
jgi:hypothetical protein